MTSSQNAQLDVIERGDFKLHYQIEGNGQTAIVIGSVIYYPRTFSPQLRKHLRLIFMNQLDYTPL